MHERAQVSSLAAGARGRGAARARADVLASRAVRAGRCEWRAPSSGPRSRTDACPGSPARSWLGRSRTSRGAGRDVPRVVEHVSEAREAVLARIRSALADVLRCRSAARLLKRGARPADAIAALFVGSRERVRRHAWRPLTSGRRSRECCGNERHGSSSRRISRASFALPASSSSRITGWRRRSSTPWTPRSRRAPLRARTPGRSRSTAGRDRAGARSRRPRPARLRRSRDQVVETVPELFGLLESSARAGQRRS